MIGLKGLLEQESAFVYAATAGTVVWQAGEGASDFVLGCLTALGVTFILAEKVRAIFRPRVPPPKT